MDTREHSAVRMDGMVHEDSCVGHYSHRDVLVLIRSAFHRARRSPRSTSALGELDWPRALHHWRLVALQDVSRGLLRRRGASRLGSGDASSFEVFRLSM